MTSEEVRIALGLKPFPSNMDDRCTGRTTKMICDLLAVASRGQKVALMAPYPQMRSSFVRRAKAAADRVGIDQKLLIEVCTKDGLRGLLLGGIFEDQL